MQQSHGLFAIVKILVLSLKKSQVYLYIEHIYSTSVYTVHCTTRAVDTYHNVSHQLLLFRVFVWSTMSTNCTHRRVILAALKQLRDAENVNTLCKLVTDYRDVH